MLGPASSADSSVDPHETCRLSKNIEQSVKDKDLKVHGIKNLCIIDDSIFLAITDCRI